MSDKDFTGRKPEFVWVIDTGIGLSAPRVRKFKFRRWPEGDKGGVVVWHRGRISHMPAVSGRYFAYNEEFAQVTWKAMADVAIENLKAKAVEIGQGWQVERVPEGG